MTYSLHTLSTPTSRTASAPPPSGSARLGQELGLLLGLATLVFCVLALLSYSSQDPAWTTSGVNAGVRNWGGRLGAWLADVGFFMLGFSVWWCVAAGMRAWLTGLARWMRGEADPPPPQAPLARFAAGRLAFWLGLALLLVASTALEWSRLYRLEPLLPGHGGGVLGFLAGPASVKWLGFTGSGLVSIVVGVLGAALVFRFSWGLLAERIGAALDGLVTSRREKREIAEDLELGKQAAREREEVIHVERRENQEHHPEPVLIEPVLADLPKSERVAKERQKPLFVEHARQPAAAGRLAGRCALLHQEPAWTVETLEMTSRLIEKEASETLASRCAWSLAAPGPVITRYEIEPATGVKGSQVMNLAKDLARSLSLVSIRVVETIPGKNYMALELPNAKRQSIRLSENSRVTGLQRGPSPLLTVGPGQGHCRQSRGGPIWPRCPHVLVAGTTGSGKSVGIKRHDPEPALQGGGA
jgi:S-DNA-T family DNA segregation ATPase FtsK/SpoIIIE